MTTSPAESVPVPAVSAVPTDPRVPIRRLPVPCSEPPYDDERESPSATWHGDPGPLDAGSSGPAGIGVQGTLALSFVLPSGLPAVPQPPTGLRLVTGGLVTSSDDADPDDFGPQPTARDLLPAPRSWAVRVVQAIVEVLAGVRPATQLVRWTSTEVYEEIASRVVPGPVTAAAATPRGVVRSVHVTEPADGIAEVCALVRRGTRSTAVALRLEGMDGRWQCTALELG